MCTHTHVTLHSCAFSYAPWIFSQPHTSLDSKLNRASPKQNKTTTALSHSPKQNKHAQQTQNSIRNYMWLYLWHIIDIILSVLRVGGFVCFGVFYVKRYWLCKEPVSKTRNGMTEWRKGGSAQNLSCSASLCCSQCVHKHIRTHKHNHKNPHALNSKHNVVVRHTLHKYSCAVCTSFLYTNAGGSCACREEHTHKRRW